MSAPASALRAATARSFLLRSGTWLAGLAAAAVAMAIALVLALDAGVKGVAAVRPVARITLAMLAFFTLCGYAPARALVRGELARYRPLFVLPLGLTVSSLSLAVLGLLHLPLVAGLAIVIVASVAATGRITMRADRRMTLTPELARSVLPLFIAAIVAAISLIPIWRAGFTTVPGQNGDAILVVGSAELLEHAPPTATRPDLPINHIPLEWRSKYPIYFALAAVSKLSGKDPINAFAIVSALMLAMIGTGFFLLARFMLRAPPWVALLALFLVPLDRILMYVTIHPYYNELWGTFTLPFILLFGWRYLSSPDRATGIAFLLFLALGLLAYPLMLPFPALFLIAYGWSVYRRRRRTGEPTRWISGLGLPRPNVAPWMWAFAAVIAVPVAAVLLRGFFEKAISAAQVAVPGGDLTNWGGAIPYFPFARFLGSPETAGLEVIGVIVVCAFALLAMIRLEADTRAAMLVMVLATTLIGIEFRFRRNGQLFYFKDLAFLGPYVLALALVAAGALLAARRRAIAALGLAGIASALVFVPIGASREINGTFTQITTLMLQLRDWDRSLPHNASIRIDLPPIGLQLWTSYMLHDHPRSAVVPLRGFFPHPPLGRKADYVIVMRPQPKPADAIGTPVLSNGQFELWRMNPAVPGPDVSRRGLINDVRNINLG